MQAQSNDEQLDSELQNRVKGLCSELENMAPNMRAVERLGVVQDRLKTTDRDFEDARKRAKRAKDDFQTVKEKRFELFSKAFSHISEQIGPIYKDLTRDASLPMGGQAYESYSLSYHMHVVADHEQIPGHGRR